MSTSAVNQSQIPPGRGPIVPGPGPRQSDILPSLFGGYEQYPVHANNFILSFLLHVLAMALLLISGMFFAKKQDVIRRQVASLITDISPYVLPPSATQAGGGGGGGDRDKLAASKGSLPKFAKEQFTPPMVVIRNQDPKLAIEPTVVVPPEINLPRNQGQLGDPLQGVLGPPSSGTGYGSGIGSGSGGGVGSGRGPGVGPGWGGGIGGGPYRVGGGVSAPRAIFRPEPEYSEEARKAKFQGTVVLSVVVGPDGRTHDIRVRRSLGLGLDEKAVETVRTWRFEPARKDGQPVAVLISIEVNFRLY
jgi:TonB family protein